MPITETLTRWKDRPIQMTWIPGHHLAAHDIVTQVSGLCYTPAHQIVVVSQDGSDWTLPGGEIESGETLRDAFTRGVRQAACAQVTRAIYLGTQRVDDPQHPHGMTQYYQAHFAAHVDLAPFDPQHAMQHRKLIAPHELEATLNWETPRILRAILSVAQAAL